jgi:hypothetical protein
MRRYASIEQQLRSSDIQCKFADRRLDLRLRRLQQRVSRAEHAGGDVDALEELPELREVPALVVLERLVGQPLEQHRAGHDLPVKILRRFVEARRGVAQGPVERVEAFPHLVRDRLADAAGVFSGAR